MRREAIGLYCTERRLSFCFENEHLVAIMIGAQGEKLPEMTGPKNVRPTEAVERDDVKYILDL